MIPLSVVVPAGQEAPDDAALWTRGTSGCYPPGSADVVLPAVDPVEVAAVFQATVEPATAWAHTLAWDKALVQEPFIVFATVGQRQWDDIALPGGTVDLRVDPVEYAWTFGDGSAPLVTDDPGAWYPDHTVFHQYTQAGDYAVQLTTTFTGEYSVAGGPWLPVPGTAVVASAADPVRIVEARAVLTG